MNMNPKPLSTFRNYLNINDPDSFVYRIVPIHRLYELYSSNENVLVAPRLWEDPSENFVLNSTVVAENGEEFGYGFKDDYYGQCWTTSTTSDAMWRIYSPDARSVRIRSTARRLALSLAVCHPNLMNSNCFVGKVIYTSDRDLAEFAKDTASAEPNSKLFAQTLLRKRRAFAHEREVRVIYHDAEGNARNSLYKYPVDPHALIDQILIDPRTDPESFIDIKAAITRRTQFAGELKRSLLYDVPVRRIDI